MSRNSKQAQRIQAARVRSKSGVPGPKRTEPKHGKDPKRRLYSTTSRSLPTKTGRARVASGAAA